MHCSTMTVPAAYHILMLALQTQLFRGVLPKGLHTVLALSYVSLL